MSNPKVLLIDDDRRAAQSLERVLRAQGFAVTLADRGDDGLARAQSESFDAVITDLRMPGLGGLDLVRLLHEAKPRLPIVLMTAFGTTETAIEATKLGAFEYLLKPFEMPELIEVVSRAVASSKLMTEVVEMGHESLDGQAIVGRSRAMQVVYKEIGRVASTSATVLIRGETGTGKELVARALYQHSGRAQKPFIAVNCAAIPETLLESEVFGHERGAFTGADQRRIGRFEQAHQGTLFLDEIGDMSAFTQAKLLRVLQDKVIQRVGGKQDIPVDVRIIAATHRDLEKLIAEKQFREDLYYRLSGVVLRLPPLRERQEDVQLLANYFCRRFSKELGVATGGLQPDSMAWLSEQSWPGNVRQLENTLRQALLLSRGYPISRAHLESVADKSSENPPAANTSNSLETAIQDWLMAAKEGAEIDVHARASEAMERVLFSRAIALAQGNQAKAARWLNVSRQTMREKLRTFGLKDQSTAPHPNDGEPDIGS
jgi:nitrogen regulation protein NR(I)